MCNEYEVEMIDGKPMWVVRAIGGGSRPVGYFDPENPEIVTDDFDPTKVVRFKLYPDGEGPIIRLGEDGRFDYQLARWGFPPFQQGAPVITNIRNLASAYWRPWLHEEWRCLVPVSKFCEWTDTPDPVTGKKSRRWFRLKQDTPFMFAGIWRTWTGTRGTKSKPVEGEHLLYAFCTTEPNSIVKPIHAKAMPVILTRDQWMTWLTEPWDVAKKLIHPSPDDAMAEPELS